MTAPRSILIGCPHALMAEGYDRLLREAGYHIISICPTAECVLATASEERPDLILYDMCLLEPEMKVVRLLSEKGLLVAVTCDLDKSPLVGEAVRAGAKGCITFDVTLDQFLQSVKLLMQGAFVVSGKPGQLLLDVLSGEDPKGVLRPLSGREQELAILVAQGASNREIADALLISEHTVKIHLGNILTKLDVKNRQQLAAYVAQQGLLTGISLG